MAQKEYPDYSRCPIRNVVGHLGDKWSLLVLYTLYGGGQLRFNEIRREMTDISQKMLTSTLKKLEDLHLVHREVFPEVPPRVEYRLTELGESLMPHLMSLVGWAKEHFDEIVA